MALKQAADPAFQQYAQAVIENARALAAQLRKYDYKLQTEGSDNHLVLWDLRPLGLTGSKLEKVCDFCHITLNKVSRMLASSRTIDHFVQNAVVGDTSAATPGGVRLGTPALTSRSMGPAEMTKVADFLHRAVQIALSLQKEAGSRLLKDFVRVATEGNGEGKRQLEELNKEVAAFAQSFPLPGIPDTSNLKRPESA